MVTQNCELNPYEEADFGTECWMYCSATFLILNNDEREVGECGKNEKKQKIGGNIQPKFLERNKISLCSCS